MTAEQSVKIITRICLFAELLLTQLVQSVKLLSKHNVLLKSTTGQLHSDDDRPVWNHHRHCSKVDLQVLWQFLPTCVAGILPSTDSRQILDDLCLCRLHRYTFI